MGDGGDIHGQGQMGRKSSARSLRDYESGTPESLRRRHGCWGFVWSGRWGGDRDRVFDGGPITWRVRKAVAGSVVSRVEV